MGKADCNVNDADETKTRIKIRLVAEYIKSQNIPATLQIISQSKALPYIWLELLLFIKYR